MACGLGYSWCKSEARADCDQQYFAPVELIKAQKNRLLAVIIFEISLLEVFYVQICKMH